jgi:two-component system phosphate regulon response regulator PhoB
MKQPNPLMHDPFPVTSDRRSSFALRAPTQTKPSKNILIIEDEQDVIDLLALHLLKDTSYIISTATNGVTGLEKARAEVPWMIILDLMLPEMSGMEICRILKADAVTRHIPIIMLTAKASEADRVAGLERGADDYVTKPFSPREVILRIKSIERRRATEVIDEKLKVGTITLDPVRHHVTAAGKAVRLTTAEFKLLTMLMKKPGRLLSREMLLTGAWGYETLINTRTVDTHVRRLRHKLGKAAGTIETVRGFGYRMRQD